MNFYTVKNIGFLSRQISLFLCLLWSALSHAEFSEAYRLSGDLVPNGDVNAQQDAGFNDSGLINVDEPEAGYAISSNSQWAVYLADQNHNSVVELFSVPTNGGASRKLNNTPTTDGDVLFFRISPDSKRVVYLADQETDGLFELYSVDIAGKFPPIKLNQQNSDFRGVLNFAITADSSRVVYTMASDEASSVDKISSEQLQSVSITGDEMPKMLLTLELSRGVVDRARAALSFRISANNEFVVSVWRRESDDVLQVLSIPINGGSSIRLNDDVLADGGVTYFDISPSGDKVIINNGFDIRIVPIRRQTPPLFVDRGFFPAISDGGGRIIYLGSNNGSGQFSLLSQPVATGPSLVLIPSPSLGLKPNNIILSSDRTHVVMGISEQGASSSKPSKIYSNSTGGGTPILLNGRVNSTPENIDKFAISSDNKTVFFTSDRLSGGSYELFSVPINGGSIIKLSSPLKAIENIVDFKVSPDSRRVVYNVVGAGSASWLYSASVLTGEVTQITPTLSGGMRVDSFEFSGDSRYVVYRGDLLSSGKKELFASQLKHDSLCPVIKTRKEAVLVFCL